MTVTFPPANAGKGRAYYYEVAAVDELPKIVRSFRVRPVGFFGAKGHAVESGG